ncbi:hypothetical protein [Paracoccus beibuensis]|uniref:hypothetical protein n=1 Tax=Paracoccus beibuensis TaxID=547602 RepID=UPI00223F5771|nr:hypothetical protein [Paracoccus beibuensis]
MSKGVIGYDPFAKSFKKAVQKARRKAGQAIGGKAVKARQQALGAVSPRRKKAVRKIVTRDGMLILLDHAPLARIQETGGTISGKGGPLFIQDRRRRAQPGDKTFVTKEGYVMAVKPWIKNAADGTKLSWNNANKRPRLIGVLKSSVYIKPHPASARFEAIVDRFLPEYYAEIDRNLYKDLR